MPGRRRSLTPGDTRPLAIQLAQAIADEIARQVYRDGDNLPGERQLAEKWSVSDKTARDAIALLASKHLLRKGMRTQAATVAGTAEDAARVRTELQQAGARTDTQRIDDLEERLDGTAQQQDVAELRQLVEVIRDRLGMVEARVLGDEEAQDERDNAQRREPEGGLSNPGPATGPVASRQ